MASQDTANKILTGKNGNLWFNGSLLANISKFEAKVKGDFDDVNFCGDGATYKVFNGWTGEGTITLKKVDSTIWAAVAAAYKSGVMPDFKIVSSLENPSSLKAEKVSITGVIITEFVLAGFEAKKQVEEEYPFSFGDYTVTEDSF